MEKKNKYLFVCRANANRSVLGERVFKKMLAEKGFRVFGVENPVNWDYAVYSAGIDSGDWGNQFKREMIVGTRNIFVADSAIEKDLVETYGVPITLELVNLEIEDIYNIHNKEHEEKLSRILRQKLAHYLPIRSL